MKTSLESAIEKSMMKQSKRYEMLISDLVLACDKAFNTACGLRPPASANKKIIMANTYHFLLTLKSKDGCRISGESTTPQMMNKSLLDNDPVCASISTISTNAIG